MIFFTADYSKVFNSNSIRANIRNLNKNINIRKQQIFSNPLFKKLKMKI